MRNFGRVLKMSWNYRTRLFISIVAALMVAACWSLNISSVYPVMQILGDEKNLQQWCDEQILHYQQQAEDPVRNQRILDLRERLKLLDAEEAAPDRENQQRRFTKVLAELEAEQNYFRSRLYRYRLLKSNVIQFLPSSRFHTFIWIIAAVILGIALKGLFEFIQETLVGVIVHRTMFDLRNQFFRVAVHQDLQQLSDVGPSEFMTRMTNDIEQMGNGMKMLYGRVMLEPLKMLGCIIGACVISWQLTMIFVFVVVVAMVTLNKVSRSMKRAARRLMERMSVVYRVFREVLDGLRLVKGFSRESLERRRFRAVTIDFYKRAVRLVRIDALVGPLLETLGVAAVAVSLVAGAYLVLEKKTHILGMRMVAEPLGFEALLTLYMFLATIADPVRKLSSVYTKMQSSMVAADRIFALMDRPPSITPNASGPRLAPFSKQIEFHNVCFSYHPEAPTLSDINLTVRAGEVIGLVGPNGSGKSTLLGLIPRFYDPDHGSIVIDGIPLREAQLRSLRKQIGIVTQQTVLFDDTILNNIAFGAPGASREQVIAAAKKAFAHEFIELLPEQYDTRTGDIAGTRLSGGQQQRLALARAILRDPRILILDEFTSQIDVESEARLQLALKDFVRQRTTFLITHRTSVLELADRIIVMEAGRIVAIGSHQELLLNSPTYRRLYDLQLVRDESLT